MSQKIKNLYHWLVSITAAVIFGFPARKLTVIGVTGTDGKTTTVNLIHHILKSAGWEVGVVSSINAIVGEKIVDTGPHVTTPSPYQVQKLLRLMVDAGCHLAVLEVTSHALDQNRVAAVHFKVGVLTNVSSEHLDYHKTYSAYFETKMKLLKRAEVAVVNHDDLSFKKLPLSVRLKMVTYGLDTAANFNPHNFPLKVKLPGVFNLYNALAAAAACTQLGIDKKVILKAVSSFRGLRGRMEEVNLGQPFKVVIDFAHTPNALRQALNTLRDGIKNPHSRLIAVFGAAGERDRQKRPAMGQIASTIADLVVLTAEDPRHEDVNQIIQSIASGCFKANAQIGKNLFIEPNRYQAIKLALLELAKRGDVVAILGKGHERTMAYGDKEYPWSDLTAVKRILKSRSHER